jgi:hypothetical protein
MVRQGEARYAGTLNCRLAQLEGSASDRAIDVGLVKRHYR